jgi:hypothetical protein
MNGIEKNSTNIKNLFNNAIRDNQELDIETTHEAGKVYTHITVEEMKIMKASLEYSQFKVMSEGYIGGVPEFVLDFAMSLYAPTRQVLLMLHRLKDDDTKDWYRVVSMAEAWVEEFQYKEDFISLTELVEYNSIYLFFSRLRYLKEGEINPYGLYDYKKKG